MACRRQQRILLPQGMAAGRERHEQQIGLACTSSASAVAPPVPHQEGDDPSVTQDQVVPGAYSWQRTARRLAVMASSTLPFCRGASPLPPAGLGAGLSLLPAGLGAGLSLLPAGLGAGLSLPPSGLGAGLSLPPAGLGAGLSLLPAGLGDGLALLPPWLSVEWTVSESIT